MRTDHGLGRRGSIESGVFGPLGIGDGSGKTALLVAYASRDDVLHTALFS